MAKIHSFLSTVWCMAECIFGTLDSANAVYMKNVLPEIHASWNLNHIMQQNKSIMKRNGRIKSN